MPKKPRSRDLLYQFEELNRTLLNFEHFESEDSANALLWLMISASRAEDIAASIQREIQAIVNYERSVKI